MVPLLQRPRDEPAAGPGPDARKTAVRVVGAPVRRLEPERRERVEAQARPRVRRERRRARVPEPARVYARVLGVSTRVLRLRAWRRVVERREARRLGGRRLGRRRRYDAYVVSERDPDRDPDRDGIHRGVTAAVVFGAIARVVPHDAAHETLGVRRTPLVFFGKYM